MRTLIKDCKHRNALKIVCEILNKKLENISCSANEVRHLLLKLKPSKSPELDHIAPCVLREYASEPSTFIDAYIKQIIPLRFIT